LIVDDKRLPLQAGRVAAVVAFAVILSAIVATFSLGLALQFGRLSVPPLYDDVVYFLSAAQWLNAAPSHGIAANLYGLLHQHAPFATLTAIIGFKLIPDGHLGPYAINAFIILGFLLGIACLTWRRSLIDIATCLAGAACVPVLWQAMTEARPDLPSGLALGLVVGAILHRPFLQRRLWSVCLLGVLSGLAVGIKPTAFTAALACVGIVAAGQLVRECLQADIRTFRAAVTRAGLPVLLFAAGLFAAAAPIIGVDLTQTIQYVLKVLVHDRDFWATDESLGAGLLHYSIGFEGRLALNDWLWVGLVLVGARFGLALLNDRRDLGGSATMLVAILAAYAIPSLSSLKSYFTGAMFYGVFIVTMTLNFGVVAAGLDAMIPRLTLQPAWRGRLSSGLHLLPLVVVLLLFVANCLPGRIRLATALTPDQIQEIRTATTRVWSLLQQKSPMPAAAPAIQPGRIFTVSFSSPYPVTPTTIQLYAVQAGIRLDARGEFFNRALDDAEEALLRADVAIITSSIPHNLPGPRMGDELIARMDASPAMCLVDSLPLLTARVIRIYRRGDPGCASAAPEQP
jgi:hypothetical protein